MLAGLRTAIYKELPSAVVRETATERAILRKELVASVAGSVEPQGCGRRCSKKKGADPKARPDFTILIDLSRVRHAALAAAAAAGAAAELGKLPSLRSRCRPGRFASPEAVAEAEAEAEAAEPLRQPRHRAGCQRPANR